jgi:hypothetical protein
VYADIGTGTFWANAAEAYAALLGRSGLPPVEVVEGWRAEQTNANARNAFLGASVSTPVWRAVRRNRRQSSEGLVMQDLTAVAIGSSSRGLLTVTQPSRVTLISKRTVTSLDLS